MSGGSMDYLYSKVLHCADFSLDTPEREAFAKHLKLVAQALHDIEWVDSGDYGPGDETAAIQACLNPVPPQQAEPVEPVAWVLDGTSVVEFDRQTYHDGPEWTPLYTAPPQRKPLTDEEIDAVWDQWFGAYGLRGPGGPYTRRGFARAVERAHGITDPQIEDRLARHGIPMPEGDPK